MKCGLTYDPVLMCPPVQTNSCIDELSCTGAAQVGGDFGPKAAAEEVFAISRPTPGRQRLASIPHRLKRELGHEREQITAVCLGR